MRYRTPWCTGYSLFRDKSHLKYINEILYISVWYPLCAREMLLYYRKSSCKHEHIVCVMFLYTDQVFKLNGFATGQIKS